MSGLQSISHKISPRTSKGFNGAIVVNFSQTIIQLVRNDDLSIGIVPLPANVTMVPLLKSFLMT